MGSLTLRFGVAAIACLVGIVASTVLSNIRSSRFDDRCCHDALVAVERDHHLPESWERGFFRKRIDNVQLYVESVEFSDGTTWSLPLAM